jgi:antitoxin component of MazEF toxin-antitoxin module
MARRNTDESHKFTRVGKLLGREEEGDKAVIVQGGEHTRVAAIGPGPDHNALPDTEELVDSGDVFDIRHVHNLTTGRRRVVVLPPDLCRRLDITEGTPLRVVEHEGRFEVIPMKLVPASDDHSSALAGLLGEVTAENLHSEVDTGYAVGRESW